MIGKALYTINKEAKRMRDLKYAAAEFYEQNYTDNEDLKIYLEQRGFEFDENGRKVVYDQYGCAFYDLDAISNAIKEAYRDYYDEEWDNEEVSEDLDDLYKCKAKLTSMLENERKFAHDFKMKQEDYYNLKSKVLKKLELKPIAYHDFHGIIMALYEYEGFTFHQPVDELPEGVQIDKEIDCIDSTNTLEEPISVEEAIEILKSFLEK